MARIWRLLWLENRLRSRLCQWKVQCIVFRIHERTSKAGTISVSRLREENREPIWEIQVEGFSTRVNFIEAESELVDR